MNIKWDQIKTYLIDIGSLKKPRDIVRLFKENNIDFYLYEIVHLGQQGKPTFTVKYGMSADNSRDFGDRAYRQIAHCTSWGKQRIKGNSGADFFVTEHEIKSQYGIDLDHKLLRLRIWDMTGYQFDTIDYYEEINKIEGYFIDQYKKVYGRKPIGNLNDEHNALFRPSIRKATFNSLFV